MLSCTACSLGVCLPLLYSLDGSIVFVMTQLATRRRNQLSGQIPARKDRLTSTCSFFVPRLKLRVLCRRWLVHIFWRKVRLSVRMPVRADEIADRYIYATHSGYTNKSVKKGISLLFVAGFASAATLASEQKTGTLIRLQHG